MSLCMTRQRDRRGNHRQRILPVSVPDIESNTCVLSPTIPLCYDGWRHFKELLTRLSDVPYTYPDANDIL
jgi:hypothetical protein